ncbi:MAG TPA: hypothetical protein VL523_19940 [Terriglobia bacterium]|nr:hypothetical protein [Terriglobia bacterium]
MAHRKGGDPKIIVRQDSTLPPQSSLQAGIWDRCLLVKRKDERRLKAFLKLGNSPLSPISLEGAEEQLTYGDE